MKFLVLSAVLIGLSVAQFQGNGRRDGRCPLNENSTRTPTQLPHPTDCGMFLKCHNGNAFELQCPRGQHWNRMANTCDSPRNANCQLNNNIQPIRPPGPEIIRPPQPQRPWNPRPDIQHPDFLNCPDRDFPGTIVYFPYHLNCSQFYQCVNGRAVLLTCPAGHSWNIAMNFCDRVENVRCATPRRPL